MNRLIAAAVFLLAPVAVFGQCTSLVLNPVTGQLDCSGGSGISTYTVSTLPVSPATNTVAQVTDGTTATDCTVGSGTVRHLCSWTGSVWIGTPSTVSGSSGVTSVATNNGVTGGTITATGTVGLASIANNGALCNNSGGSAAPTTANCTTTGTGNLVMATSPTLTTPNLGTPSAATLTNATGLPISTGVSGLGTGAATFLGTPSSANLAGALTDKTGTGVAVFASSPALTTPNLGTPSAATLTNATGLPISTGVSGLGTGVATFLATPSSANLAAALTNETGTGAAVFANSPTLVTPALGTPSSGDASNLTNLPITLTTTGSSGAATYTQATNTLNVPQYSGGGGVTSIATTSPITGGTITTTGTIACATCVTSAASLTSGGMMIGGGSQASSTASNTVVINGGTNVISGALAANTRLLITANVTQNTSAIAISQSNVTIDCTAGVKLTQTTAGQNLFTLSGSGPIKIVHCILDKNSAAGGALISTTASNVLIEDNVFQNQGTNTLTGTAITSTGGNNVIASKNYFDSATEDPIYVDDSAANVAAWQVINNYFAGLARGTDNTHLMNLSEVNGSFTLSNMNVLSNTMLSGGACVYLHTSNIALGPQNIHIAENICQLTGISGLPRFSVFGMRQSVFEHNIVYDGGNFSTQPSYSWNDMYDSSLSHNIANLTAGVGNACAQLLDNARNNIQGNIFRNCEGNTAGLLVQANSAQHGDDNVIVGNSITLGSAGIACMAFLGNSSSGTSSRNVISSNRCTGTNTASQTGISFVLNTGIVDSNRANDNYFYNLPTGISLASGVTGTSIGVQDFNTVTALFSDSGTASHYDLQCHTWNVANSSTNLAVSVDGGAATNTAKAAALTQSITLFALPPMGRLVSYTLKTTTLFAGTATLVATLGDSVGTTTSYSSTTYNLQTAVGNTNFQDSGAGGVTLPKHVTEAGSNVLLAITATTNNISSISAGSVNVRACFDAP